MENQYVDSLLSKLSNIHIPTPKELEDNAINSFIRNVVDDVLDLVNSESKIGKFVTRLTVTIQPNFIKLEAAITPNIINELLSLGFKANWQFNSVKYNEFNSVEYNEWYLLVRWDMNSPSNPTISKFIVSSMESLLKVTVDRIKNAYSLGKISTEIPTGDVPYSSVLRGVIIKILTDKGYTVTAKEGMSKIDISW